jgi:hypothetical protein
MERSRFLVVAFAAISVALFAANVTLPDPRGGNVDGLQGILFWPANLANREWGNTDPLPSAEGCDVHLVPWRDMDQELRYPCGKWFALPFADRFNYWLESNGRITPTLMTMVYSRKPFAGVGSGTILPLTSAGRIAIPSDRTLPASESFRLLSIEAKDSWLKTNGRVFDRRVSTEGARASVQMPVGRVIAGRFDRATNNAVALSRPIEIKAATTTPVWPAAPRDSDLLVVLSKMPELQLSKPIDVNLSLDRKPPDVLVNGFERIVAIWYGVTSPAATVALESSAAQWAPLQVRFTRGKVATVRAILAKK